ncbi:MAG: type I methionyl aminopeptidase [Vicinamibacteria bacterium]
MSIESSADWDGLRAVAAVVRQTLALLVGAVEPGITTEELDRMAEGLRAVVWRAVGTGPRLRLPFVLVSVNEEAVHRDPGPRVIAAGDVVSFDVTLELDGYVADAARSVVVGAGTDAARRLVGCAETAFDAGLGVARAGVWVREIGRVVEAEVRRHGFTVVRGCRATAWARAIHEPPTVPNWWDPRQTDRLTDRLVIAIEPIVSAGSGRPVEERDGWTIRTADRSIAAHHEETVVITHGRPIVPDGSSGLGELAVMPSRQNALGTVLRAGVAAGTLDILGAFLAYAPRGIAPCASCSRSRAAFSGPRRSKPARPRRARARAPLLHRHDRRARLLRGEPRVRPVLRRRPLVLGPPLRGRGLRRHDVQSCLLVPRRVEAAEVQAVRAVNRVVGWRYYPEAKGRKPFCSCRSCNRGEIRAKRLREPGED